MLFLPGARIQKPYLSNYSDKWDKPVPEKEIRIQKKIEDKIRIMKTYV